uniref:Uncharacterized protein n=1 Tax=Arundo donax TaxID=35708 RepID=A0A0A8YQ30_ARUDO
MKQSNISRRLTAPRDDSRIPTFSFQKTRQGSGQFGGGCKAAATQHNDSSRRQPCWREAIRGRGAKRHAGLQDGMTKVATPKPSAGENLREGTWWETVPQRQCRSKSWSRWGWGWSKSGAVGREVALAARVD